MTSKIVYSNVWEDPELNRLALRIKPNKNILSITSGGCNSLCLLLEKPNSLISIDLNPAQLSMLELKKAAIKKLDYQQFITILGVPFIDQDLSCYESERLDLYKSIKSDMPQYARDFWDENLQLIKEGVMMCGKVEKFYKFYRKMLGLLYNKEELLKLFQTDDINHQREVYQTFRKRRWRALHRILLNRRILSLVKGSHSFAQVDFDDFAGNLNKKLNRAMNSFYNPDNWFMSLILLGAHYHKRGVSPYLLEENYPILKEHINKLHIYKGTVEDVLKKWGSDYIDYFNMSNIFEWMTNEEFNEIIRQIIKLGTSNARMAWRYTLARPRELDASNLSKLQYEPELSKKLFKQDRAFIYESFHVYHIK